jgi:hypothetical protein
MKKYHVTFVMGSVIALFLLGVSVEAQNSAPKISKDRLLGGLPSSSFLPSMEWVKEPWMGNDKPFVALRQRLDAEAKQRKGKTNLLTVWVNSYAEQARRKPKDAKAQFAWGYSATTAQRNGWKLQNGYGLPRVISQALAQPASPKSYQYDRLRFVMAMRWQQMQGVGDLALRLLKRNPDDYEVQYFSIAALFGGTPVQRQAALRIARQIEQKKPNTTIAYAALANAYWGLFMLNKRRTDGDKAIAYIQKELALRPVNYAGRAEAEDLIQTIRRDQARPGYLRG